LSTFVSASFTEMIMKAQYPAYAAYQECVAMFFRLLTPVWEVLGEDWQKSTHWFTVPSRAPRRRATYPRHIPLVRRCMNRRSVRPECHLFSAISFVVQAASRYALLLRGCLFYVLLHSLFPYPRYLPIQNSFCCKPCIKDMTGYASS